MCDWLLPDNMKILSIMFLFLKYLILLKQNTILLPFLSPQTETFLAEVCNRSSRACKRTWAEQRSVRVVMDLSVNRWSHVFRWRFREQRCSLLLNNSHLGKEADVSWGWAVPALLHVPVRKQEEALPQLMPQQSLTGFVPCQFMVRCWSRYHWLHCGNVHFMYVFVFRLLTSQRQPVFSLITEKLSTSMNERMKKRANHWMKERTMNKYKWILII